MLYPLSYRGEAGILPKPLPSRSLIAFTREEGLDRDDMKWGALLFVLILAGLLAWRFWRVAPRLVEGNAAPEFQLKDQQEIPHRLNEYRGRWVVLYFYPKDDTPGCTREACSFRDDIHNLRALNAEIMGLSVDDAASHARFATRYHLPFPLLSDPEGHTAAAYGALFQLGPLRVARRQTFIVTPEGRIGRVFRHVDPTHHAMEVAQALKGLQSQYQHTGLSHPPL